MKLNLLNWSRKADRHISQLIGWWWQAKERAAEPEEKELKRRSRAGLPFGLFRNLCHK